MPSKINFRMGGLITAGFGFVIGALWVSVITKMGMFPFVNTLGAILAPVFGIMITDYYIAQNCRKFSRNQKNTRKQPETIQETFADMFLLPRVCLISLADDEV